ncbi:TonB-dependent receptor [uncultured Proteiniphilum sp.]|uniref:TonB-dependent receptor n=1 Tax=uncultured Proteiniphilum sp. TaxID=497637 RepID=UPI0026071DBE|nr:TonB-dependent receptor [uncultured Proteiniphilum sp.]
MKKIYVLITALALSAGSFAQTADSLLRRQMELERDFNPTLLDADKINSLPALREPVVQKANTNYSSWAGRTTPPLEIALPRPGNIMTEIPYSRKKGYLSFNAGNYANLNGAFGYRLVENEKNNLAFTFLHNSTNGDVKYVQNVEPQSNKAYFMDNEGSLGYRHRADALTLNLDLSYLHSLFNYYGNRFGNEPLYADENQSLGVLDAKVGVASHESDLLNYRGYINFRNFSTKFGDLVGSEGIKGNEVNAMVGFDKPFFDTQSKLGIDGKIFTTFYNGDLSDYFLINATPYITFGSSHSYARLGADVMFQISGNTKARVAPNVKLQWAVTEHSSLYAHIHGGFSNNTFLEMIQESRYIRPYGNVRPSYSIVDIDAGAKIGEVSGFRFDLFGGFKKTDDEHFLILNGRDVIGGDGLGPYREVLRPVYGDLSHAHIGGMIQSNIWAPLDISLRLKKNFYSLDYITMEEERIDDPKAYNKPGFEADIRAAFNLTGYLKLTASYYFAGDRWSYYDGANREMDNINDLNAGALYQINDAFSINLRANNLFSQKYDIWYGYPAQGFNASGGFTFRF